MAVQTPVPHEAVAPELQSVHRDTLGLGAVSAQNTVLNILQMPDHTPEMVKPHLETLATSLNEVRLVMNSLTPFERAKSNRYLQHYFRTDTRPGLEGDLASWLADQESGASDRDLLGFLNAHVAEIATQQNDERLRTLIQKEQHAYTHALSRAGEWLARTTPKKGHPPVFIGDIWDTTRRGAGAYYHPEGYMVVEQLWTEGNKDRKQVAEILWHERTHAEFDGFKNVRWFNEAGASHVRLGLQNGDFVQVDPELRKDKGEYELERKLLATLLHNGRFTIDTAEMTRAFSSAGRASPEAQQFFKSLDAAWGFDNMFNQVTNGIKTLESAIAGDTTQARKDRQELQQLAVHEMIESLEAYGQTLTPYNEKPQHVGAAVLRRGAR